MNPIPYPRATSIYINPVVHHLHHQINNFALTNLTKMPSSSVTILSKSTVHPAEKSALPKLKLSVSDLPMLSCHYIQKGVLLPRPPRDNAGDALISLLTRSLSSALTHFPPLAGRLETDSAGHVFIVSNDAGVDFIQARAERVCTGDILAPTDVPNFVKEFFAFDRTLSYSGHFRPLLAVQVTELADGLFVGCTVNHAVTDGTSFWHFFNTFAEIAAQGGGARKISKSPDFCRKNVFNSPAVLSLPDGGPGITFSGNEPLRERIFHFSREAISELKLRANGRKRSLSEVSAAAETLGKKCNDGWMVMNGKVENGLKSNNASEISSFQSLGAQLWRAVTRARKLAAADTTTFRMAVNCRQRVEPKLDPHYFGNLIHSIPTVAMVGELLSNGLRWGAHLLHENVVAHDDKTVRRGVEEWERNPRLFPLGNFDGGMMTMGSSPRFPMYENDFGWGRPLAVRSGGANKFDGKISAFPGREGGGSVDLEVVLAPETMAGLEKDEEFMQYVSVDGLI